MYAGANLMAQAPEGNIKFRLAQSYERAGNYETATPLYEELLKKDSLNVVVLEALQRNYLQLKRYDDAINLLQRRLTRNPRDLSLLTQLGTLYIRKSDEPSAVRAWDKAIATDPARETTYRVVAGAMIESRLFDRAVTVYKNGRTACKNPAMFTGDVAYLYSIMLNYSEATREYLSMIHDNGSQLNYVQLQLSRYTGRKEGLDAAIVTVENAVRSENNILPYRQLLAWLYMEGNNFDKAFDMYKTIDRMMNAGGNELYNFAERSLREKAYTAASKAFLEVQNKYPKFGLMAQVKFGYARTLEESASGNDTLHLFGDVNPFSNDHPKTESSPEYSGALAAYNRILNEYPKSEQAARSLYRIAVIQEKRFFDLDAAKNALETLEKSYTAYPAIRVEGILKLGDIILALGKLDAAAAKFTLLLSQKPLSPEQHEQAMLRLAEIDYYKGNFQNALTKLQELTKNSVSDITNDGLSLQIFIQDNMKTSEKALRDFSSADVLIKQRKLSEALEAFNALIQAYPKSDLIDEAIMKTGDALTHMKRFPEAIASYEKLLRDFPESISLDRAVMKTAQIYQLGLSDKTKAIDTYQKLLTDFPNSIYVSEARKRIRELRGDTI